METEIFYWTGCVIWWGLCLMVIAGMVTLVIITPLVAFSRSKSKWWRWLTLAKFADLGWTQEDLNNIAKKVGGIGDESLEKMGKILKASEEFKQSR